MAPSLLGPFFMSQISFFRLVSVKVSNKGLEKKFNIAIAVLFTTIIGLAIACVSQRLIGDQNGKRYSIGPIHQVSYNKNVTLIFCGSNHLIRSIILVFNYYSFSPRYV